MDLLVTLVIALPTLVFSIAIHEMVHALVSDRLGDDTARHMGRISLNPLRHIDPITTVALPLVLLLIGLPPIGAARPVPFNPHKIKHEEFGVALVAISGPLSNLLLAFLFGGVIYLTADSGILAAIATIGLYINVGFFVFNMIPFPPLDGSRVLYAFAPTPLQRIMEAIESFGWASIIFFMFVVFPLVQPFIVTINQTIIGLFR